MVEKPKQPSEWRRRRAIGFTSPFNLRACQQRLQKKVLGERRLWKATVLVSQISTESREVHITRGLSVIEGRLDMLTEKSTLVSLSAHSRWTLLLGIFAFVVVIFSPPLVLGLANFISNSLGWGNLDLESFTRETRSALGLSIMVGFAFSVITLLLSVWRARRSRSNLLHDLETALLDPIPDIPDLSALEMDGEIVFTPNLVYSETSVETDNLAGLLKPKSGNSKHE